MGMSSSKKMQEKDKSVTSGGRIGCWKGLSCGILFANGQGDEPLKGRKK